VAKAMICNNLQKPSAKADGNRKSTEFELLWHKIAVHFSERFEKLTDYWVLNPF
jgi:hypothetical protein